MAHSISNIICQINKSLEGVFKGSTVYGVATNVEREGRSTPVIDGKAVSYDDSYSLQLYHKLNGISIDYKSGYGNTKNTINTYSVSAVVFNNENITKLKQDEIAIIIQSILSTLNIVSVQVLPTSIILNSQQIFSNEYKGVPYALNEYQSLMQVNYQVAVSFKGNCFTVCPEDY